MVTYEGLGTLSPVEVGHDGPRDAQRVLVVHRVVVRHTGDPLGGNTE